MPRTVLRLRAVQLGFALAAVVLIAAAAKVQLIQGSTHEARARAQRTEQVDLPARRGAIYDRNRAPLTLTLEQFHVGVTARYVRDTVAMVNALAENLGLSTSYARQELRQKYSYFHGPFSSAAVQPLRRVWGVDITSELTRFHPNPEFARTVLGRPGGPGRAADGIERVLDTLLTGRPGSAVVLRDQFGRKYESPSRLDAFPQPGHDVYLTLDAEVQEIVDGTLVDAMDRLGATGGDVVVMNPKTGELLAVAARSVRSRAPSSVFTSVFEPGSTAKIFAAAALLKYELVGPSDSVWGEEGRYRIGNRILNDEHDEGWMRLPDVIRRSSNIGIVKFASRLSSGQQFEMLRDFGLGSRTGIEFPVESQGLLARPARWTSVSGASLSIGYELAVTTLQLAAAYAAIANDGVLLQPTLLSSVYSADGEEVYRHRPRPVRRVVSVEVARELRAMLRGVTGEEGTGSTAALVRYDVGGKTGTARRAGPNGRYIPGSCTASFASMFPVDEPQLVMVVKLEDPEGCYARTSAAPLTRSVLEQVLAAQTSVLDASKLRGISKPARPGPSLDDGVVPYVLNWPLDTSVTEDARRPVPPVKGMSLREAARRLHQVGLRVRAVGWGTIDSVAPRPGTPLLPGALVTVVGREGPTRR